MVVCKKIIAVFCSISIVVSLLIAPASAAAINPGLVIEGLGVIATFGDLGLNLYDRWKAANPDAPDSEYPGFNPGGMFGGGAGRDDLPAAYDAYVQGLPSSGYNSAGKLLWQPTVGDLSGGKINIDGLNGTLPITTLSGSTYEPNSKGNGVDINWSNPSGAPGGTAYYIPEFIVPISGTYIMLAGPCSTAVYYAESGSSSNKSTSYKQENLGLVNSGGVLETGKINYQTTPSGTVSANISIIFPTFAIAPNASFDTSTYNTTTRPTSITGGNYGVVGDNNEITKVEDNSTIINETNNTYYNPATGTTVPITNWSYDYSDRSYKVTLESGDTATITYGDENISITETNSTSGDTVTNNYTIYYLVDAPETPVNPDCSHEWTETGTTAATCTVPGSKVLTCSLCSQAKTESIPALGHDWEVKQTVTTQYDETGQLTQQGYTVFECGTCHEQYKSEDGVLPPAVNPGSGTDIAAVDALKEKLQVAIDAVLGIFNKLPELFSGFTDFLAAVFPFVPTEFITIFELGLFLLIAAAALRKFLS